MFPILFLLLAQIGFAAAPNDNGPPQFQVQIQNAAGNIVDPISRDWTLSNSTDSVSSVSTDLSTNGTLTSGASVVSLSLNGQASLNVEISGTWSGTITVIQPGVVTGHQLYVQAQAVGAIASTITANGNYRIVGLPVAGTVNVAFSTYTSGTATVNMRSSTAPFYIMPYQLNAANLLTTSWLADGVGNAISSSSGSLNVNVTASALPAGAATAALQSTANASLASIDAGIPTSLGQTTMANSMPVAIASDQSAIPTTARSAIAANAGFDISVANTSTAVLGANANRKGLILINAGTQQITIAFGGQTPTYQTGLTLLPGGVFNMDQYSFTTGAVNAITSGGSTLLQVQEFQ